MGEIIRDLKVCIYKQKRDVRFDNRLTSVVLRQNDARPNFDFLMSPSLKKNNYLR